MKYYLIAILVLLTNSYSCLSQEIFEDKKAIPIEISDWVGSEPVALSGKIIVLEFWATWCLPCINAIPHMNELANNFPEDKVLFLSINAHESAQTIEQFMEKTTFKTKVVRDLDKKTLDGFGVTLLPKTCIVDADGNFRWKGDPGLLTEELLNSLLENNTISTTVTARLSFSYSIEAAKDRTISEISHFSGDEFGFQFKNKEVQTILGQLFSFTGVKNNELRYINAVPIEPHVDMFFKADSTYNQIAVYQQVLLNLGLIYGFSIDTIIEIQRVIEMEIVDPELFASNSVSDSLTYSQNKNGEYLEVRGISMRKFTSYMEYLSKTAVYYKGELNAKFNCSFFTDDFEKTQELLRSNYGISLEFIQKNISVIQVHF